MQSSRLNGNTTLNNNKLLQIAIAAGIGIMFNVLMFNGFVGWLGDALRR